MFKIIMTNFHLEKIFWILKKKIALLILVTLIGGLLGGGYAFMNRSSTYTASVSFYIYSNQDYANDNVTNLNSAEVQSAARLASSYIYVIRSSIFLNSLIEQYDLQGYSAAYLKRMIRYSTVSNTAVFIVYVDDPDPIYAMKIANAITELAPDFVVDIVKSGGISVLERAQLPTSPSDSTSIVKYAAIAAAAFLLVTLLIVLIRGLKNTTVRRKYEIEDLFIIPILGTVPNMIAQKRKQTVDRILSDDCPFVMKESYSDVRMNMLFTGRGESCPVYAITSADPNEGKSLTSINVAISHAQLGKRVLLIDADMRKSNLRKTLSLDIDMKEGLSDYLAKITDKKNIIRYNDQMDIFLAGSIPPNPSELLSSQRWLELIEDSRSKYDVIIIDLPPCGVVSDALVVNDTITGYILVVREGVSKFDRDMMIVSKLEAIDAKICGIIYNGISVKSPDYNYSKYGYSKEYGY